MSEDEETGIKMKDKKSFDKGGGAREVKGDDEKMTKKKTFNFKNPDVDGLEKFMFQESPYHRKHVVAEAIYKVAEAVKNDQLGSIQLQEQVRDAAANYFLGDVLGAEFSPYSMTKNLSLKQMFESATGMTDDFLGNIMKSGEELTEQTIFTIGQQAQETYSRWSEGLFSSGIQGAMHDPDKKSKLEARVRGWNDEFNLSLQDEDFIDRKRFMGAYFSGIQQDIKSKLSKDEIKPYRPFQ